MAAVEQRRLEYIWQKVGIPFTVLSEAAFKQLAILILEATAESENEDRDAQIGRKDAPRRS